MLERTEMSLPTLITFHQLNKITVIDKLHDCKPSLTAFHFNRTAEES